MLYHVIVIIMMIVSIRWCTAELHINILLSDWAMSSQFYLLGYSPKNLILMELVAHIYCAYNSYSFFNVRYSLHPIKPSHKPRLDQDNTCLKIRSSSHI